VRSTVQVWILRQRKTHADRGGREQAQHDQAADDRARQRAADAPREALVSRRTCGVLATNTVKLSHMIGTAAIIDEKRVVQGPPAGFHSTAARRACLADRCKAV